MHKAWLLVGSLFKQSLKPLFFSLYVFIFACSGLSGCIHREYNQQSHQNAYLSLLNIPAVDGTLTNHTGMPVQALEMVAFWDCDFVKNAVIFTAPGDCGSQEKTIEIAPDGAYTTPAYMNIKSDINPTSTGAVQTVRFAVGVKRNRELSARTALTSSFESGEKISFRTDALTYVSNVATARVRRVTETKDTHTIMKKVTVYKIKKSVVPLLYKAQKNSSDISIEEKKLKLQFTLQFIRIEAPFGTVVQSVEVPENQFVRLKNGTLTELKLPEQLILMPGVLEKNPVVKWKLTLGSFAEETGHGTLTGRSAICNS